MTTQKSLVPFEQTVGHLINIIYDGLEDGGATAAAIKAQFGPYCDCAMAAWIIDGIDNAETDPTVMNKLRELLAADPAAVIERVVRQSPPERLLRRFCQGSNLMGGYMGVTGTEILQTLQDESALCPPEPTEAPDDGFFIYDSLIGVVGTPTTPVEETYFINTVTNFPLTAKLTLPLTGYEAKWGTSEETVANIVVTNNSSTSYSVGVGWRGPTYGLALTRYTNIAAGATVNVAIQALCDTGEELTVWVNISALVLSPGNNYYFEFPYSRLPARPSTNTTSGNDFLTHMPEIGLGYMVRNSQSFLEVNDWNTVRARAEVNSDGLDYHYGLSADPGSQLEFTPDRNLVITTRRLSEDSADEWGEHSFINTVFNSSEMPTSPALDPVPDPVSTLPPRNPTPYPFPATHFNKTVIPNANIETGITVRVRNKNRPWLAEEENDQGNWPSHCFVVLVFDTPTTPSDNTASNITRSYEDGYGSALLVRFGHNTYGPSIAAILLRRTAATVDADFPTKYDWSYISEIKDNFENNFAMLPEEERAKYPLGFSPVLNRKVDVTSDTSDYEVKFSVKTFHGQYTVLMDDVPVVSTQLDSDSGFKYDNNDIPNNRCGFYVGSFSEGFNYDYYNDTDFDNYRSYIMAKDYYVKSNSFAPVPVKLIWDASNRRFEDLTVEQRTSDKSILIGLMTGAKGPWDTQKVGFGHSQLNGNLNLTFSLETPDPEDYKHFTFSVNAYTENNDGTSTVLSTYDDVTFDPVTATGMVPILVESGFLPFLGRNWGNGDAVPQWDNDIWCAELVIMYKGFKLGIITIMQYAPTSQIEGNGAYVYGTGFTIFSAIQYA